MQQQVNLTAAVTLSLPAEWDADKISDYLRSTLGAAFGEHLPPAEGEQSPVNFTFKEEAEIYGNDENSTQAYMVACPALSNLLYVEASDEAHAAHAAMQDCTDGMPYGEAAGDYKVYAFCPLGGCGALVGTYEANENGEIVE